MKIDSLTISILIFLILEIGLCMFALWYIEHED